MSGGGMLTRLQWLYVLTVAVILFALAGAVNICREVDEMEERMEELETMSQSETVTSTPDTEPTYYDIPLSHYLQDYTMEVCEAYGLDPEVAYAVMHVESRYQLDADSGQAYGLMQISGVVAEAYGVDVTDPKENIKLGCWLLATYYHQYEDMHKALMAYNQGPGGAAASWAQGVTQTDYSRAVTAAAENLRKEGRE